MRKRSKYRPRTLVNPLAYVLESITPVAKHDSYLVDLQIKNHDAMAALTQGRATRDDIDTLIPMVNVVEALYRMGFGQQYADVVQAGLDALHAVAKRGVQSGRFILRAEEMTALNTVMELHDAQMQVITVGDMDRAMEVIKREFRAGKMRSIVEAAA